MPRISATSLRTRCGAWARGRLTNVRWIAVTGDDESGPILDVDHGGHRARISLFGGHVFAWQPAGQAPAPQDDDRSVLLDRTHEHLEGDERVEPLALEGMRLASGP